MKRVRRIAILIAGGTLLLIGFAMIILPGPAFIVIPAGLAILAIEFAWARRWLRSTRAMLSRRPWNAVADCFHPDKPSGKDQAHRAIAQL